MIDNKIIERLNQAVLKKYNNSDNGSWKEDNITEIILEILKDNISEVSLLNKIKWNICKYSGTLENMFGDIAFVIKIYFTQDKYIEGVYFIEAKKFDFNTNNYSSIKFENLERYIKYSQAHSTMLYNINLDIFDKYNNILTLPTQHLIALNDKSENIQKYSGNFEFLLNDLFDGKNLDYRKEQIDDAKGFVSNTKIKFKYIINTAIALNRDVNIELSEINNNLYENIDTPNKEKKQNNRYWGPSL